MSATIVSDKNLHFPVLLNEVLSIISPQNGGTFIDCTFGQGGYTKKILEFPKTKVIAFDRDQKSRLIANTFKKKFKVCIRHNFCSNISTLNNNQT